MNQSSQPAGPIVLVVGGAILNTLGIALVRSGPIRYVLMGAGVLLLLIAVLLLTSRGRRDPDDSAGER